LLRPKATAAKITSPKRMARLAELGDDAGTAMGRSVAERYDKLRDRTLLYY